MEQISFIKHKISILQINQLENIVGADKMAGFVYIVKSDNANTFETVKIRGLQTNW